MELIDDIDGAAGASTLSFSVDGTQYEIELSDKNRARFDKALAPYIDAARRIPRRRQKRAA